MSNEIINYLAVEEGTFWISVHLQASLFTFIAIMYFLPLYFLFAVWEFLGWSPQVLIARYYLNLILGTSCLE
jgi:hypothetical protein